MSKSNICFNVVFLIKELNLKFADMWTYEIFEISNIFNSNNVQYVCTYRKKC